MNDPLKLNFVRCNVAKLRETLFRWGLGNRRLKAGRNFPRKNMRQDLAHRSENSEKFVRLNKT